MGVWLREHSEHGYRGRTLFNAANADLTIAFTVDDTTAGERLTRKAATEARYCHIDLNATTARIPRFSHREEGGESA